LLLWQASVQEDQRGASGNGAYERRQRIDRRPGRARHGGDHSQQPEHGEADHPDASVADRGHPQDGGHGREHHADADQQHRLVVGSEGADREALQPFGGEIDRGGSHCDHRRGLSAYETGHEVGDGERYSG
jgi:hypothetical protein